MLGNAKEIQNLSPKNVVTTGVVYQRATKQNIDLRKHISANTLDVVIVMSSPGSVHHMVTT